MSSMTLDCTSALFSVILAARLQVNGAIRIVVFASCLVLISRSEDY